MKMIILVSFVNTKSLVKISVKIFMQTCKIIEETFLFNNNNNNNVYKIMVHFSVTFGSVISSDMF